MRKKIIGLLIIMLFVGTGVLSGVSGKVVNSKVLDINTNISAQSDTKSTHVVFFIVGLIKDKQKINSSYNFYSFMTRVGLCLYIDILAHPRVIPILWINYDTGLLYDFKIGFFGNNFVCAAFFVPRPESTTII